MEKELRMLVQLLSIVILHYVSWIPACIVVTVSLVRNPPPQLVSELQSSWILINIIYIGVLGCPLTSLFALPEVKEKASEVMHRRLRRPNGNRVHAVSTNTRQLKFTTTK